MKYFARENGGRPFTGPCTSSEIAELISTGQLSPSCELLPATGQSEWALRSAVGWEPASSVVPSIAEEQSSNITLGCAEEIQKLHALQQSGALSQEEFDQAKKTLLSGTAQSRATSQSPSAKQASQQAAASGCGGPFFIVAAIIAALLAISNPSEADMRQHVAQEGWAAVGFSRTSLVFFSVASVRGITGAQATFVGIGGNVFRLGSS